MRNLLHKFLKKSDWKIQRASLEERSEPLVNPARGWYEIFTFDVANPFDEAEYLWCLELPERLALLMIDIGSYREKPLDEVAIQTIHQILHFFAKNGFDIILRIVYDHEGKAAEREPFFFAQILEHLEQVIAVVNQYAEAVFVWQGMLVGNWGEMHGSRFLEPERMQKIWSLLLDKLDSHIYVAVRKPAIWRMLHANTEWMPGDARLQIEKTERMGLFDDAIFGSESHMGTFAEAKKADRKWQEMWNREEEMQFEETLCNYVPAGGEALLGKYYEETYSAEKTLQVLQTMHLTYLNKAYDKRLFEFWSTWEMQENGSQNEINFLAYVGAHLGYRFLIKEWSVQGITGKSDSLEAVMHIANTGFAGLYQESEIFVKQVSDTGEATIYPVEADVRGWKSGSTNRISIQLKKESSKVYVSMKRKWDGKTIYFANLADETGAVYLGKINVG